MLGVSHAVGRMILLFRITLIYLSYISCSVGTIVRIEVWKREKGRARHVGLKWKRGVTQGK